MALGRELVRPMAPPVPLMIGAGATAPQSVAQADSIAGTWVPEGFFNFLPQPRQLALTEQGQAALKSANIKESTQNECIPVGAPMLMHYPTANRIEVARDVVRIHVDWMDAERVVYLDGRKPPANAKPTLLGFSTGKWDGKTWWSIPRSSPRIARAMHWGCPPVCASTWWRDSCWAMTGDTSATSLCWRIRTGSRHR